MGTASKNFDFSEFEVTNCPELAEKNRIDSLEILENVKALVDNVLQPLRDRVGMPITVNSGYRCPEVNERAGGVSNSQHLTGSAADIKTETLSPFAIANIVIDMGLPFDQMILYPTFTHISHVNGGKQRGQLVYDKTYKGRRL